MGFVFTLANKVVPKKQQAPPAQLCRPAPAVHPRVFPARLVEETWYLSLLGEEQVVVAEEGEKQGGRK